MDMPSLGTCSGRVTRSPTGSPPVHSQAPLLVHLLARAGEHHDRIVQASAGRPPKQRRYTAAHYGLDGGQDAAFGTGAQTLPAQLHSFSCGWQHIQPPLQRPPLRPSPHRSSASIRRLMAYASSISLRVIAPAEGWTYVRSSRSAWKCIGRVGKGWQARMHRAGGQGMAGKRQPAELLEGPQLSLSLSVQVCSSPRSDRTRGQQVLQLVAPQAVARHHLCNEALDARGHT